MIIGVIVYWYSLVLFCGFCGFVGFICLGKVKYLDNFVEVGFV